MPTKVEKLNPLNGKQTWPTSCRPTTTTYVANHSGPLLLCTNLFIISFFGIHYVMFSVKFAFFNLRNKNKWEEMSSSIKHVSLEGLVKCMKVYCSLCSPNMCMSLVRLLNNTVILHFENVSTFCILKMCQHFVFWKCVNLLHFENVSTFCNLKTCQRFASVAIQHKRYEPNVK